jgi:hypothetical protein
MMITICKQVTALFGPHQSILGLHEYTIEQNGAIARNWREMGSRTNTVPLVKVVKVYSSMSYHKGLLSIRFNLPIPSVSAVWTSARSVLNLRLPRDFICDSAMRA